MNSGRTRRKRSFEKSVALNLTFAPTIIEALEEIIRKRGYKGPVEYFSARVRRDAGLENEIPVMTE